MEAVKKKTMLGVAKILLKIDAIMCGAWILWIIGAIVKWVPFIFLENVSYTSPIGNYLYHNWKWFYSDNNDIAIFIILLLISIVDAFILMAEVPYLAMIRTGLAVTGLVMGIKCTKKEEEKDKAKGVVVFGIILCVITGGGLLLGFGIMLIGFLGELL